MFVAIPDALSSTSTVNGSSLRFPPDCNTAKSENQYCWLKILTRVAVYSTFQMTSSEAVLCAYPSTCGVMFIPLQRKTNYLTVVIRLTAKYVGKLLEVVQLSVLPDFFQQTVEA